MGFLSFKLFALEPFEKMKNVKMLRVLPDNVVMIGRGLEDGIQKGDHLKISNETDGFGSRAICVKTSATTAYLKLYRIPNPAAFSLDYTYTLQGIADREIPFPEASQRDHEYEVIPEEKKAEATTDPFLLRKDLPERLTERDLLEVTSPTKRKLYVEEALNKERFKEDMSEFNFSIYASPFVKQSINEGENYRYGFRGGNVASKYRFLTQFDQQQSKLKDPITEKSVSTRSTTGQAQLSIHRVKKDLSTLSLINYESFRFSSIATPKNHWQVGPLGFTWHLYENKSWDYFDLSYIPLIDMRETETKTKSGESTVKKNGLRHGLRLGMKKKINERVSFENLLWFRPFQKSENFAIDFNDSHMMLDLKMAFNLTTNLYFDYNLIFMRDVLWSELNDLPENNTINSVNLRYDFDIK